MLGGLLHVDYDLIRQTHETLPSLFGYLDGKLVLNLIYYNMYSLARYCYTLSYYYQHLYFIEVI